MRVELYRLPVAAPQDISALRDLVEKGQIKADQISAVIAQNEGDAYARGFTLHMLEQLISGATGESPEAVRSRVPMLMIGLANIGSLSPHLNVFVTIQQPRRPGPEKRLVIGTGVTRDLRPEEQGTMAHVREVAATVRKAMKDAGLNDPADVHCAYVKVPELTNDRIADAEARKQKVRSYDFRAAAVFSRGAAGLGVGLALGEIKESQLNDDMIAQDWSIYSHVAHVSSGIEQTACKVVVMGNAAGSASDLVMGHCTMKDTLDLASFKDGLRSVGLDFACCPDEKQLAKIDNIFIGTGAYTVPTIRGRRHVMHSDFLWSFQGVQAKAMANAVIASVVGDTMFLSKSGCEHQGPRGSNLVAIFARP
jgi:cyanuric acid amidohydrolase